jgi:hypothetical protein
MKDFEILLTQPNGTLLADVITSDVGRMEEQMSLDLTLDRETLSQLWQGKITHDTLTGLGKSIYDAIFKKELLEIFKEAENLLEKEDYLRLRFTTESDVLNNVPLEALCQRRRSNLGQFALSPKFSIVRSLRTGDYNAFGLTPPIRMLVLIAGSVLSGIDVKTEYESLEKALKPFKDQGILIVDYLGVEDEWPATKEMLDRMLRDKNNDGIPYHIFHFIGHGALVKDVDRRLEGALQFVGPDGREELVYATPLARSMAESGIALVTLHACEGAKAAPENAFQGVAQCLIDSGIPVVVAMQWEVAETVARVFFNQMYLSWLSDREEIERAVTAGRKRVADEFYDDPHSKSAWVNPALFMHAEVDSFKLAGGSVTVRAETGFKASDWEGLTNAIRRRKCIVFLGPDAGALTSEKKIRLAAEWAQAVRFKYPYDAPSEDEMARMQERCEGYLARVAQYISVTQDPSSPKEEVIHWLRSNQEAFAPIRDTVLTELARLPISVYVTTNYDDLIEQALENVHLKKEKVEQKKPQPLVCIWSDSLLQDDGIPEAYYKPRAEFTSLEPAVFHFYGLAREECAASLVLSEDDYLDFLVHVSKAPRTQYSNGHPKDPWPRQIRTALQSSYFLFLGYRHNDLSFRILLKSIGDIVVKNLCHKYIAVQIVPPSPQRHESFEDIKKYLETYLEAPAKLTKVSLYCGTHEQFVTELLEVWDGASHSV